jgi:glycosyltransferase involved in cell wall biosynthesis
MGSPSKQINVLLVSHSSGLYGSERSLLSLVQHLSKRTSVIPYVLLPSHGPLADALRSAGATVFVARYGFWFSRKHFFSGLPGRLFRIALNASALLYLSRLNKRTSFDIVYSNSLATPLGAFLARYWKIPHVWHAREFVEADFGGRFDLGDQLSWKIIGKFTDQFICNSNAVRKNIISKIPHAQTKTVYNGFESIMGIAAKDKYRFSVEYADLPILVSLGLLDAAKGHEDAIRAIAILRHAGIHVQLALAGSGTSAYRAHLQSIAIDLGVADNVEFLGFVSDVQALLKKAAITLVCSRAEAFGRTAVESMLIGTPVIGTNSGGLPEVVEDARTGLLYPPGDASKLARQIRRLLEDERLYFDVCQKAHESAESRFTILQYVTEIESTLVDIAETTTVKFPKSSTSRNR